MKNLLISESINREPSYIFKVFIMIFLMASGPSLQRGGDRSLLTDHFLRATEMKVRHTDISPVIHSNPYMVPPPVAKGYSLSADDHCVYISGLFVEESLPDLDASFSSRPDSSVIMIRRVFFKDEESPVSESSTSRCTSSLNFFGDFPKRISDSKRIPSEMVDRSRPELDQKLPCPMKALDILGVFGLHRNRRG